MRLLYTILASLAMMGAAMPGAAETIALTDARLIDGTGAPPQIGKTVIVEGGRIAAVFDKGSRPLPANARMIRLSGLTLMPGLIDSHVHVNLRNFGMEDSSVTLADRMARREADMGALLRSGVTTIREMAGDARITRNLQRRQANGDLLGPAIRFAAVFYGSAFLDDGRAADSAFGLEPGTAPWSRLVTPDLDLGKAMAEAKASGATGIKLYASLTADQLMALSREARRQGLLVWTHSVIFPAGTLDALAAGADTLVHAKGMVTIAGLDGIPDNFAEGTRQWMRTRPYAEIDPDSTDFRAAYAEMVRTGTILEPALTADGDRARQPLPPPMAAMRDWACRATSAAHNAGVAIAAGTDSDQWRAGQLQQELGRLVDCGLSPIEAIRAATQTNARALGMADTHGTVEAGKVADLIAVAGDPARDIGATNNIRLVIQAGRPIVVPDQATGS